MKKFFLPFLILKHLFFFSQQNFINVPSVEVTKKHKLFFQQQFNFSQLVQSNSTIDYGLGKGFELGVTILGLNFDTYNQSFLNNNSIDTDPYNPLVMLNSLKYFKVAENIGFAFGTQVGLNYSDGKRTHEATLAYGNLQLKDLLVKESNLVMGSYYNSKHYGGSGNRIGVWLGAEIPIINKLHFLGESVLGNNAISFTSLALVYYPTKHLPLTFGFQLPNTKNNSYSFVFELTYVM